MIILIPRCRPASVVALLTAPRIWLLAAAIFVSIGKADKYDKCTPLWDDLTNTCNSQSNLPPDTEIDRSK